MNKKELAEYMPLVKKISGQLAQHVPPTSIMDREEIESFGWEGLLLAFKNYDASRTDMTFRQYAGWSIRNTILAAITQNARVVKISYYYQQKMKEGGMSTFNTSSLDRDVDDENINTDHLKSIGVNPDFEEIVTPIEALLIALKENFTKDYVDIFKRVYGLDGKEPEQSQNIAKEYNVSNACITLRIKRMIKFIRKQPDLMEGLSRLID